ncbi:MAG: GIY-YIG nuclease family protein [Bryobacterales bacterium]|nr:GIY-YIG nuclease family protein [Bryobacterales bacterium]
MIEPSDLDLLDALGVKPEPKKKPARLPREERIVAGFEEIQRFYEEHGRAPLHGEERDIFERLYAVRLDRIRQLDECRLILEPLDHQGLLDKAEGSDAVEPDELDDAELLARLGVEAEIGDISQLRHVRSSEEKRAAEEIANRQKCSDFEKFRPLFQEVQKDLELGLRRTRPFELKAEIRPGSYFIVGGQKAYVAEMAEMFSNAQGRTDARLRVIFDNGTESNLLMRSLQRALHKDEAGRRITDPTAGPLFAGESSEGDDASGTIYVLRSNSSLPMVAKNRDVVHKIGVTRGSVKARIANAADEPTFLMAGVEVVAEYELYNIDRNKLESLIHRIFDPARLEIEIVDRFGKPVMPKEWFLVPPPVVDEAVERIRDGTITQYVYDTQSASMHHRDLNSWE